MWVIKAPLAKKGIFYTRICKIADRGPLSLRTVFGLKVIMVPKSLQFLRSIDFYPLLRPLLFRMDPEKAHALAIKALRDGFGYRLKDEDDSRLMTQVCGLHFPNPIGLAAGFDKQAEVMSEVMGFGFGFIEVGTITPLPQPGNPKPRVWRVPEAKAIINRFGFNSVGMDSCLQRINAWGDMVSGGQGKIVGINIGKNKESTDAVADYVAGVERFAQFANYLTINVSSPSTAGLRDLQRRSELTELLTQVLRARSESAKKPPVFLKIAPDQTEQQEEDIAAVALATKVDGLIVSNSSMNLAPTYRPAFKGQLGGLSGKPIASLSTQLVGRMYRRTRGAIPLIGVGGVFSGADAYAKICAGASLVQIYTALIYEGPAVVGRIRRQLSALLKRDGFASVGEAVGSDHTIKKTRAP